MDLFAIAFFMLIFSGIRYNNDKSNFLSKDQTQIIKGIAAISILFHHITTRGFAVDFPKFGSIFCSYGIYSAYPGLGLFLFVAGYAVMKSLTIKGKAFLKGFMWKRVKTVVLPYLAACVIYGLLQAVRGKFIIREVIANLLTEDTLVPYSWYIYAIMLFYFVFYLLALVATKVDKLIIVDIGMAVFLVIYFIVGKQLLEPFWVRSIICFEMGVVMGHYGDVIRDNYKKSIAVFAGAILMLWEYAANISKCGNLIKDNLYPAIVMALLLVILSQVDIDSKIINFYGTISLEVYLLQGLFTFGFRSSMLMIDNGLLYVALTVMCTTVMAFIMHKAIELFWGLFKKRDK